MPEAKISTTPSWPSSLSIKSLADGQLPATITSLYTSPARTKAIIRTITLVNTDSSARTLNLYLLPSSGTARRLVPKDLSLGASYAAYFNNEITLETGDAIQGDASAADVVDYTILGYQEP